VLLLVTVLAVRERQRRPWLLVGWLWFLGTLFPVVGLVQSGNQGMADRFIYVPHIGLFIAIVWTIADLWMCWKFSWLLPSVVISAILAVLICLTFVQVTYWRDPAAMWEHMLAVTPNHNAAHFHLGQDLVERLGPAAGLEHLQEAVRLLPDSVDYRSVLGKALFQDGQLEAAAAQFEDILKRDARDFDALYNLGQVRIAQGRWSESVSCFEGARQVNPQSSAALAALGQALMNVGRSEEAAVCWQRALQINGRELEALIGQGQMELRAGRNVKAMEQFSAAATVSLKPEAFSLWGLAAGRAGKSSEAIRPQEAAIFLEEKRLQLQSRPDLRDLRLYRQRLSAALEAAGEHERSRLEQEAVRRMPAGAPDSRPER
jgi:tetratricopeptide (TPR) repeat protein